MSCEPIELSLKLHRVLFECCSKRYCKAGPCTAISLKFLSSSQTKTTAQCLVPSWIKTNMWQITCIFHPLLQQQQHLIVYFLPQQHLFLSIDHFIPFHLKYCINTVKKRFEHQHEQYIWVIHENRLAYVCPWITTATINHCDSFNNNLYVSFVILKYTCLVLSWPCLLITRSPIELSGDS